MNPKHIFRALGLLAISSVALTGCDDDFEYPPVVVPTAPEDVVANVNSTVTELKQMYWNAGTGDTWSTKIGTLPTGDSIIIAGTIISSDVSGNIYKNMMVRGDDGEAVTFAIDKASTDSILSRAHKFGQRIYINVTGMSIGMYRNYMEIGAPSDRYGISYIPRSEFDAQSWVDGMPQAVEPVTTTIPELLAARSTDEGRQKWQSQLVKIENVRFVDGGKETFGANGNYGERDIVDAQGNRLNVRSSGKCTFAYTTLPTGTGTLVGILGYFNTNWQVQLIDINRETSLIGFDWDENPDTPTPDPSGNDGSATKPFSVSDVLSGASGSDKWVTGYIVGWIDGKSIQEGATFSVPATSNTNLLLADAADVTDATKCVPVQVTSQLRSDLGLQSKPENLGKQVTIKGNLAAYFGQPGLKEITAYAWGAEGTDTPDPTPGPDPTPTPTGNITFTKATSIVAGKRYIFVNDEGKVAIPIKESYTYGYLYVTDPVSATSDKIVTDSANALTIEASGSSYTIKDVYGRYLSMDETHNSFQLYKETQAGSFWTGSVAADSRVTFSNNARSGFIINWAAQYSNFSVSTDTSYPLPYLYVEAE